MGVRTQRYLILQTLFSCVLPCLCLGQALNGRPDPSSTTPSLVVSSTNGSNDLLRKAVQALGGTAPEDAVIVGSVTITAGTLVEDGTVKILTKRTASTAEEVKTSSIFRRVVFSNGVSAEFVGMSMAPSSFGRSLSAQSTMSPITFLSAKLTATNIQVEDEGSEQVDGKATRHLRLQERWTNDKALAEYQQFTKFDIWLNPDNGLPQTISYRERKGLGAIPWTMVRVEFGDYHAVDGLLYPFHILKYINGTLWADIHIASVHLNAGLSQSEFEASLGSAK